MSMIEQTNATEQGRKFPGRIRNTFLLSLLPISIFFILLMGGITYLRARSAIQNQINTQLNVSLEAMARDFDAWLTTKKIRLDLAVRRQVIEDALEVSIQRASFRDESFDSSRQVLIEELDKINRQSGELLFNQFLVVLPDGEVITASQPAWEGLNIFDTTYYQQLSGRSGSLAVYDPSPFFADETVIFTAIPYSGEQETPKATLFAISGSGSIVRFLQSAVSFNPAAQSYLITEQDQFIQVDPYQQTAKLQTASEQQLREFLPRKQTHVFGASNEPFYIAPVFSFEGTQMISNYTWLPSLRAGLVIELPQAVAFGELNDLGPYTLAFTLASTALLMVLIWFVTNRLVQPLHTLTLRTSQFARGDWSQRAPENRSDEIGALSHAFNQMAGDLTAIYETMESQVNERTQSLEKRSQQLEATALVAREASAIRDLEELLTYVTHLINEHFGFYHAGIFLVDKAQKFAVLQASNSEGGQRMLARSHRLEVGQKGVVGFVAASGLPRIALDVGEDAFFFDNPDLPDTRSEMALPLKIRGKVIGVLDVQSKEPGAFEASDVEVLQILSDQIALAIENARLLEQSQNAIQTLEQAYGTQTKISWDRWQQRQPKAFYFDRVRISPANPEQITALQDENGDKPLIQETENSTDLVVPILLRGQKLGSVSLRRSHPSPPWSSKDIELVEEVLSQISVALDNTRLLDETRRYAQHEQTLSEFSSKLSQSVDIDNILRTAVIELGKLTNVKDASIHIQPPKKHEIR